MTATTSRPLFCQIESNTYFCCIEVNIHVEDYLALFNGSAANTPVLLFHVGCGLRKSYRSLFIFLEFYRYLSILHRKGCAACKRQYRKHFR